MSAIRKRQVFLVVKQEFRGSDVPDEDRMSLVKTLESQKAAELEVERLSRIDIGKPWSYGWQEWTIETPAD
jgi:hypothetical protein